MVIFFEITNIFVKKIYSESLKRSQLYRVLGATLHLLAISLLAIPCSIIL